MKIINIKNLFKKQFQKSKKNDEFIFVPLSVVNDSWSEKNEENKSSRILRTKNFQRTKKIKHPSGTTILRLDEYEALKNKKLSNKDKTQLISYKAPSKVLKKRILEPKKPWTY